MYEGMFCKQRDQGLSRECKVYMQRPRKVKELYVFGKLKQF